MAIDLGEIKQIAEQGYEAGSALEEGIDGSVAEYLLGAAVATEIALDVGGLIVAIIEALPIVAIAALVGIVFWVLYQVVNNLPVIGGYLEDNIRNVDNWITSRITSLQTLVNTRILDIANHLQAIVFNVVWYGPVKLGEELNTAENNAAQAAFSYTQQVYNAVETDVTNVRYYAVSVADFANGLQADIESEFGSITAMANAINLLGVQLAGLQTQVDQLIAGQDWTQRAIDDIYTKVIPSIQYDVSQVAVRTTSLETWANQVTTAVNQEGQSIAEIATRLAPLLTLIPLATLAPQAITTLTEVAEDPCKCLHNGGDYAWLPAITLRAYDLARHH